jgi:glycine/D-amino acid oxidase-like deaminating enzyme
MSALPEAVDVAVVGAGIVGLCAADALARRGARVVCLDEGLPGHAQSAGGARGFRHLHTDAELLRMAVESRAAWRALEARAGVELLERGGMVRLGADVEPEIAALRSVGVEARVIDSAEAAARLPALAPEAGPLLLDPDAGAIRARDAVRALTGLVGAALVRARVLRLEPVAGGVRVRTTAGDVHATRCLVCAGAGTERLVAPLGIAIERERRAAFRLTFRTTVPADGPMPVWSDRSERFGGERAYGTPEGPDRFAIGLVAGTPPLDAPDAEALPAGGADVRETRRRLIAYVRAAFPGLDPAPVDAMLRIMAPLRGPDEDRIGLWERDRVLAFAGHNLFKHAPRLGELLADAALDEGPPDPRLRPPA